MKHIYLSSVLLLLCICGYSQYTQNFDTLTKTGTGTYTNLPDGWAIYEVESGTGTQGEGKYAVGTGSSNTGNTYSFGASGSSDRALGSVASNTLSPSYGVLFYNEGDSVLTTLTITYTGEQYRYGGRTTGTQDSLRFEYSLTATGLAATGAGVWIPVVPLNFKSPYYTASATALVLDATQPANRQTISYTLTGLSIQPGGSILLRWSDVNIANNDDALAIDDFSLSTNMALGVLTSGGTNTGGGTGGSGGTVSNTGTSTPIFENKVATDSGFVHLYGNLHGHSTHSDGHASTLEPADDYAYARTVNGMDFLGISEHNHSTAGLHIADYKRGAQQADAANGQLNQAGQPFVALHGMEWGTISGGGHVVIYGFGDKLIGWEPGNYDIFVAKSDYLNLFDTIRYHPGAVATLAHPNTSDYTGLTGGYKGIADSAVAGVAVESGPAFSTSQTYNDYPASLAYMNYYRSLLKQGYRVGANMDQDNHEMTFGSANGNRIVVLAKERTREAILRSIAGMRFYASNDYNATLNFTLGGYVMGSSILSPTDLNGTVAHADADGEPVSAFQLYGGRVGGADASLLQSGTTNTLAFSTAQGAGETWYYYAIVTQQDGNKLVSSPIWVTKAAQAALPVTLLRFESSLLSSGSVELTWQTASEVNSDFFAVERSTDLRSFAEIGKVTATGSGATYRLQDNAPAAGVNYYRLRQVDKDGKLTYSRVIPVTVRKPGALTLSPNPGKGLVKITTAVSNSEKVQVQVIDMAGNRVYNKVHQGGVITLDLSTLPNGFYLVRVGDELTQMIIGK